MNDANIDLTTASAAALQTFIASGVVLVCVALGALSGLRKKFFKAILGFAAMLTAAVASFAWCDGAGRFLGAFGVPGSWTLVAGYTAVIVIVLVAMNAILFVSVRSDVMTYTPIVDRVGGAFVGAVGGILLASVVRVGFAMTPFPSAARPTPEQIQADVTPRVLRIVARILSSDAEMRRAWLYGSPRPLSEGEPGADQTTWSEPFVDLNTNGRFDEKEPYLDKDGSGSFTATFGSARASDSAKPLIGVMERYWLGNWRLVTVSENHDSDTDAKSEIPGEI